MTGPLEIGLGFYSMQSAYMRRRPHSFVYREAAREVQRAEDCGFDVLWMGEHHHAYDGYCPSLIPAGAFLAASTSRITLAAGVLIVPHHRPDRVAEAAAAFQSVAPGRLRLAVGIGYWRDEFAATGMDLSERVRRLDTALSQWRTGDLRHRLGATEIWSAQTSDAGVGRAGRLGLSMVLPGIGVERFRQVWATYEQAGGDRSRARFVSFPDVWVDHDPRRLAWVRGRLFEMWRNYAVQWLDDPSFLGLEPVEGLEARRAQREAMAGRVSANFVSGSPAEVVDRLGPLVEAGIDGFAFRVRFDGVGGPSLERCVELLAADVVPHLQRMARR